MSDMKITIEREIGCDTEASRLEYLKYVNYGRQIEAEEQEKISLTASEEKALERLRELLTELDAILSNADRRMAETEKESEDDKFEELKSFFKTGPVRQSMIKKFDAILSSVDEAEKRITLERNEAIAKLREKYLGETAKA